MATLSTPDLHALLKATAVFGHLHHNQLDAVLDEMAWLWLPGGAPLYLRGEDSDALYVVKSGSLGVFGVPRTGGAARMLDVLPAGVTLGEVGLISGEPRTHGVRALRDSEVLRLSRGAFEQIVDRHPLAMLGAAQVAVRHLLHDDAPTAPRTFAILPFAIAGTALAFAQALQRELSAWGNCALIDARLGSDKNTEWFAEREAESRFVLYVGDGDDPWRHLCRRQADALLLLVDATHPAEPWPHAANLARTPRFAGDPNANYHRPQHLILHHPADKFVLGAARAWHRQLGDGELRHHHWRNEHDIARIARLLTGHATGLVLSGGGARGFAELGAIRALREAGIAIDSVVGTSVGAIIGAGAAGEWDNLHLSDTCRRAMVDGKPLSDWTLPLVALTRGARTTRLLREAFGDIDIEDLPLPFACVSADLTSGATVVHREGRLWRWLRASSSVPGILPPVFYRGHVYVDGGVVNNLPTDVMAAEHPGRIIAVDIGSDYAITGPREDADASPSWLALWRRKRERPGLLSILLRAGMVNSEAGSAHLRELADLLLQPDMRQIGLFDWRAFALAIEIGYHSTRVALEKPGTVSATARPTSGD